MSLIGFSGCNPYGIYIIIGIIVQEGMRIMMLVPTANVYHGLYMQPISAKSSFSESFDNLIEWRKRPTPTGAWIPTKYSLGHILY